MAMTWMIRSCSMKARGLNDRRSFPIDHQRLHHHNSVILQSTGSLFTSDAGVAPDDTVGIGGGPMAVSIGRLDSSPPPTAERSPATMVVAPNRMNEPRIVATPRRRSILPVSISNPTAAIAIVAIVVATVPSKAPWSQLTAETSVPEPVGSPRPSCAHAEGAQTNTGIAVSHLQEVIVPPIAKIKSPTFYIRFASDYRANLRNQKRIGLDFG